MLKEDELPLAESSRLASTAASSCRSEQLRSAQHLADYPKRVERLKRLWIDVNGGGQWFNESSPGALRGSTPTRRSASPRVSALASPRQLPSAARSQSPPPARQSSSPPPARASPREVSAAARGASPPPVREAAPRVARPKRETARRSPSPPRVAGADSTPSRAAREASPRVKAPAPKRVVSRGRAANRGVGHIPDGGPLTRRQIQELMSRELTPEDYELLCMLDEGVKKKSLLSVEAAAALPRASGTDWVNQECRICLCALEEDEDVRMLPTCGHCFHGPCAERWLSGSKNTCPLCGQVEAVQEKVVQAFGRFDINNDGLVHIDEMRAVLFKLDPKVWTEDTVNTLFQSLDVDKNGKVDAKEFVNWIFGAEAGRDQQLLRGSLNI